jgi:malonate-semialdehyde dehydrogenase (acetylating)/methylmalonate-semialdehyde dehydrogenase
LRGSYIVLSGDTADRLIDKLAPRVKALRIGSYSDLNADIGPLITGEHRSKVRDYNRLGRGRGGESGRRWPGRLQRFA